MTETERQELREASDRAMSWFRSLSPEKKREWLKEIGILNEEGHLSERYGGESAKHESIQPVSTS